jgi:hypothetical protein
MYLVGDLISCPLGGLVFDLFGSYDTVFLVAGASLIIAIDALLLPDIVAQCKRRQKKHDKNDES